MNFQPHFTPDQTFKSTVQVDMPKIEERKEQFHLKGNSMTKNEQAL